MLTKIKIWFGIAFAGALAILAAIGMAKRDGRKEAENEAAIRGAKEREVFNNSVTSGHRADKPGSEWLPPLESDPNNRANRKRS